MAKGSISGYILPPKAQVNILLLICCTALLSTGASVVGGLIMYIQSIEVLEKNIENLSECEVRGLVETIMRAPHEVEQACKEMLLHYMSAEESVIKSPTLVGVDPANGYLNITPDTTEEWTNQVRWYAFSSVKLSDVQAGIGLILVSHEKKDPSSVYMHVWFDILADRSKEFVFTRFHQKITEAYNASSDPWEGPLVMADRIHPETGVSQRYIYNYSFDTYDRAEQLNMPLDGDLKLYTDDTPTGGSFMRGPEPFVMRRWKQPASWYSSDNNPYVYQSFDIAVRPPPLPHPWHAYKQIWFQGGFVYSFVEDTMLEYRDNNKDSTLVLYDGKYDRVYAATTGEALMNKACWNGLRVIDSLDESCVTRLANMSKTVRDAWRKVGQPFSDRLSSVRSGNETTFSKVSLGGEKHFVRVVPMFSFTPDNGVANFDIFVLWMSPESVIRSKIDEALTLLIIFAALVFIVDVVLTLLEVVFVARPLTTIASAMVALEDMRLLSVASQLRSAVSGPLCVKEVYLLCEGIMFACSSLQEFKAFLPATLFVESEDQQHDNTDSTISNSTGASQGRRYPLQLGLNNIRGTLTKMTLPHDVTGERYSQLLEVVKSSCEASRGMMHSFLLCAPEVLYMSWNLTLQCADHVAKACETALKIREENEVMAVAVVKGQFKAGNLGTKDFRAFGIRGEKSVQELEFAHAFVADHVEALNTTLVVATQSLEEEAKMSFAMHIIGRLEQDGRVVKAFEITKQSEMTSDEWMYQLSEIDDPLMPFFTNALIEEKESGIKIDNLTVLQQKCYRLLRDGRGRLHRRCKGYCAEGMEPEFI